LTNPAQSLLHREAAAKKTSTRTQLRASKLQNDILANCFSTEAVPSSLLLMRRRNKVSASYWVQILCRTSTLLTWDKSGSGSWRNVQKQSRQQTANVNKD
jgi:hypothetical protein